MLGFSAIGSLALSDLPAQVAAAGPRRIRMALQHVVIATPALQGGRIKS